MLRLFRLYLYQNAIGDDGVQINSVRETKASRTSFSTTNIKKPRIYIGKIAFLLVVVAIIQGEMLEARNLNDGAGTAATLAAVDTAKVGLD